MIPGPGGRTAANTADEAELSAAYDDPDAQHRGQARIAYRLADTYGERLMHVHGVGWYYYDGKRWKQDTSGRATRAVLDVLRRALAESIGDRDLQSDVRKCESAAGIGGVLDIASALETFAHTVDDLDPDPYLLNASNGTVNLHTGAIHPHNPRDRITRVTRAAYRPDAAAPDWTTFLRRVLPDDPVRDFLARYVGVALCGRVLDHRLAILTGEGRNGKGVFYGAVAHALGDYATTAEPDLFMHRDKAHPTGEMDLLGIRWCVVSESDKDRKLAEATVKRLTGGDVIRARRMRQDFVEFEPSHTAALVTNHLPKVSGDDPALWARLRVVPFTVVIPDAEQDPHLGERLELAADAVLAWALAGWRDYQENGLAEPDAVQAATADYHTQSDAVARFIEDCCVTQPAVSAGVTQLYDAYASWAARDGAEVLGKRAFGENLDRRGYPAGKGTGGKRIRRGIGVIPPGDG